MLTSIIPYVKHFTGVVAGVIGIDAEVVDCDFVRVAGTGIHAAGIGKSMGTASNLYRHALIQRETVFVDNPKENALCADCQDRLICEEKLTLCAPIVVSSGAIGILGLLCYSDAERERVLASRDVYINFVTQMADAIARAAQGELDAQETRKRLDMLLKITESNTKCVLVLDRDGRIRFVNDAARQELNITGQPEEISVAISNTGEVYSDLDEYELALHPINAGAEETDRRHTVLGRLSPLDLNDHLFDHALVFDSKPGLAQMLSRFGGSSDNFAALDAIIGESTLMRSLKSQVLRIAATSSTVLITGESGTGKELFARAIHAASARNDKPFVAINCGAIPDALLESELFGYVRGAFTDASPTGRMGKFELADQGVLFLDEISAMPLYLQVKLLRVLQERRFSRLGSNKTLKVDLRIIAATNERLPDLIEQKMFREDLYYRLNVIPFEIPPLRERKDDIAELADHFLERYCRLFGKQRTRLPEWLLNRLEAYNWPGNVREFENCMEYMVNMLEGTTFSPSALPAKIASLSKKQIYRDRKTEIIADGQEGRPSILPLAEVERKAIMEALEYFGADSEGKRRAAEALGIGVATIYRKVKNHKR